MPELQKALTPVTRTPRLDLTIAVFLTFHLALALAVPLIQDEAYYTLWASGPSWGYYDHPPMIAWWIAAGEWVFGANRMGVRLVPVLAVAGSTAAVWRMALLLAQGDRRAAGLAAVFYNATVLVLVLGFTATPDAPSLVFWTIASWAAVEATTSGKPLRWWALAGIAAGLGIQSKFTNIFWGVGMVGWLSVTPTGRRWLTRAGPWVGAALAIVMIVPLIWWNIANDLVGLERQFGRVTEAGFTSGFLIEYLIVTPILITPLIFWAAVRGIRAVQGPGRGLLLWLNAPLPVYMIWHSLHSQVQANWLLPIFPAVAVLAGVWAAGQGARFGAWAASVGLAISALILTLGFWPGTPLVRANNPFNQTRGWAETRSEFQRIAQAAGATWIVTDDYGKAAILWWYLPDLQVRDITEPNRYLFRKDLPQRFCDQPALMVTERPGALDLPFSKVSGETTILRRSGRADLVRYRVIPVQGYLAGACAD